MPSPSTRRRGGTGLSTEYRAAWALRACPASPPYIQYLGRFLPAVALGLLVVYGLKDVNLLTGSHGLPEFIALAVLTALHLWKRNMLLSIAGGTVCYMLLVQLVF